ncbi:Conserved oligomeric Golgi complex subunit 7 [Orchesella cincta]|uniref:Conserved oligomeric Golgi complex subunit 7 n=1 Tax=Orchesella cincta TaxID=48709 RepID=A0A1D2NFP3_ORCCI|nr:Conserved oligomeric Golgi complex subunit 7 [Orchesella cincta]
MSLHALQEADKWTSLAKEIEQLLDAGDVTKSYECIVGMEKSLLVLDQATMDERRLILEEMKNRLEALATNHLIHAFDTNDTERAQSFYHMFVNLERTEQFVKYFQNSEKIKLAQEWRNSVELLPFKEAILKLYDGLMDHLQLKLNWCRTIFSEDQVGRSVDVLVDLYSELLMSLEPTVQYCFEVETRKEPFIELLLHFNQNTMRFIENFLHYTEMNGEKPNSMKFKTLSNTLLSPFFQQYSRYSKYHETQVINKIQAVIAVVLGITTSTVDLTTALQEKIESSKRLLPELILSIKEGEEKVQLFNRGAGYYHFSRGINAGLERFAEWNQEIYRSLDKSVKNSDRHRNLLEINLSFTETCGEILLQISKLDQTLTANCHKALSLVLSKDSDTSSYEIWDCLLNAQIKTEVVQFFEKKNTLLGNACNNFKKLCRDATQLVLKVTSEPVESQFIKSFVLQDSNLKDVIPSEYITQVGEYLMLLPQNLDPFLTENSSLSFAFDQNSDEGGRSPLDFLLSNLAIHICEVYGNRILKISDMSNGQARQLAQDIDYLSSVMDDLGVKMTSDLVDLGKLTKMFPEITDGTTVDRVSPRLLAVVKKMKTKSVT